MSDPNKKRLDVCEKYLKASFVAPDDKSIKENNFDLILESVGLEVTRQQAIEVSSTWWINNTYRFNATRWNF